MKVDRVTEYANRVVNGEIICGRLHYLACKRHLNDLKNQNTNEFPYYWDIKASERILDYAETLTIAEGGQPKSVELIGSQIFDIGCRFGWKNKKGYRRFRRSYKSEARQNGKTFENGIIGTYIGNFSGYNYGKLFTVATKKRQARLAWEEMAKFIKIDPDLKELFDVKDYKSLIICNITNSTIEALSKEAGLDDGFRSIFSSIDEIHQHKDNRIYKAIYNGTGALDETLVSMITTRGFDIGPESFSYEMDCYAVRVLEGTVEADDFFVDIYALDKDDDIVITSDKLNQMTDNEIEEEYSNIITAPSEDNPTRIVEKTVYYKIDRTKFQQGLQSGIVRALTVYPFARKDDNIGSYEIDGKLSFFFSLDQKPMSLRTSEDVINYDDKLHLEKEIGDTVIDKVNGIINVKFNQSF